MTVTKRQFNHLNEMGINVWQRRNLVDSLEANNLKHNNASTETHVIKHSNLKNLSLKAQPLAITSNELTQYTLFTDILQSIDMSIGEINIEKNVIDLGLFNWQFIENETINFNHSTLSTPVLTTLKNSITLKKQLWKTIQQEVLT